MFRLQQQDKGTEMAKGQGTCRDPHWAPTDLQAQPFNTHSTSGPLSRPLRGLPTHSCYLWRTEAALSWFPIAQSLSHTHCCNSNTRDTAAHFTEARTHSHWIPLRDRLIVWRFVVCYSWQFQKHLHQWHVRNRAAAIVVSLILQTLGS